MKKVDIILASQSPARRSVLENAGIAFQWKDANVDEDAIKRKAREKNQSLEALALELAEAKACKVSAEYPDSLVIGCDQILNLDGQLFDKPKDIQMAKVHLQTFRQKTHQLIAAIVVLQNGQPIWTFVDYAHLTMRNLTDTYINHYLMEEGERILSSVGAYRLEGLGAQLFKKIEGDFFTILGLPLLPLLDELRKRGILME